MATNNRWSHSLLLSTLFRQVLRTLNAISPLKLKLLYGAGLGIFLSILTAEYLSAAFYQSTVSLSFFVTLPVWLQIKFLIFFIYQHGVAFLHVGG